MVAAARGSMADCAPPSDAEVVCSAQQYAQARLLRLHSKQAVRLSDLIPIHHYFRSALTIYSQARAYLYDGDAIRAYTMFLRYCRLVIRDLPTHVQAKDVGNQQQWTTLKEKCLKSLDVLEKLKPQLIDYYISEFESKISLKKDKPTLVESLNLDKRNKKPIVPPRPTTLKLKDSNQAPLLPPKPKKGKENPPVYDYEFDDEDINNQSFIAFNNMLDDDNSIINANANDNILDSLSRNNSVLSNNSYMSYSLGSELNDNDASNIVISHTLKGNNQIRKKQNRPSTFISKQDDYDLNELTDPFNDKYEIISILNDDNLNNNNSNSNSNINTRIKKGPPIHYSNINNINEFKLISQSPSTTTHHHTHPHHHHNNIYQDHHDFSNEFTGNLGLSFEDETIMAYILSASEREPSFSESGNILRKVLLPNNLVDIFTSISNSNTSNNVETCGILAGFLHHNVFVIDTLYIPKQHGTSDSCNMIHEEELYLETDKQNKIVLGWIHTHPSQSCFLSSVDVHTHASFQLLLPEAISIVVAPKYFPNIGIYRLTDPPGLPMIAECPLKGFHPHDVNKYLLNHPISNNNFNTISQQSSLTSSNNSLHSNSNSNSNNEKKTSGLIGKLKVMLKDKDNRSINPNSINNQLYIDCCRQIYNENKKLNELIEVINSHVIMTDIKVNVVDLRFN